MYTYACTSGREGIQAQDSDAWKKKLPGDVKNMKMEPQGCRHKPTWTETQHQENIFKNATGANTPCERVRKHEGNKGDCVRDLEVPFC